MLNDQLSQFLIAKQAVLGEGKCTDVEPGEFFKNMFQFFRSFAEGIKRPDYGSAAGTTDKVNRNLFFFDGALNDDMDGTKHCASAQCQSYFLIFAH
jgi:hypothetical protein